MSMITLLQIVSQSQKQGSLFAAAGSADAAAPAEGMGLEQFQNILAEAQEKMKMRAEFTQQSTVYDRFIKALLGGDVRQFLSLFPEGQKLPPAVRALLGGDNVAYQSLLPDGEVRQQVQRLAADLGIAISDEDLTRLVEAYHRKVAVTVVPVDEGERQESAKDAPDEEEKNVVALPQAVAVEGVAAPMAPAPVTVAPEEMAAPEDEAADVSLPVDADSPQQVLLPSSSSAVAMVAVQAQPAEGKGDVVSAAARAQGLAAAPVSAPVADPAAGQQQGDGAAMQRQAGQAQVQMPAGEAVVEESPEMAQAAKGGKEMSFGQHLQQSVSADAPAQPDPAAGVGQHAKPVQMVAQQPVQVVDARGQANTPPVADQVQVHVRRAVDEGTDRITIKLEPADLGRVHVKIDMAHDSAAKLIITAERADTLDMLQRDARDLVRALQHAGIKTDAGSLEFSLQQGQQFASQQQGDGRASGMGGGESGEQASGEVMSVEQAMAEGMIVSSGLDIRI